MGQPISVYVSVDAAYPWRLRGAGNTQGDTGLLYLTPSTRTFQLGGTPTNSTDRMPGLGLGYFRMHNRSGVSGVHGIGVRVPNRLWIAGQWVDAAATPYTDDTTDAQSTATGDFPLETTTNSDGYVIASRVPFNAVSIMVGTASSGGAAVRAVRYTNTAGTGWTTMANLFIQDGATGTLAATGTTNANEGILAFAPPVDWGRIATGGLSGIPEGYYAINVRATTAPTVTAAVADNLSIYRIFFLQAAIAPNAVMSQDFGAKDFTMAQDAIYFNEGMYGDALVCLFETANNQNAVSAAVRAIG